MEQFGVGDFITYYRNAYIVCPNKDIGQVIGPHASGRDKIQLLSLATKKEIVCSIKELMWSNVAEPRLGYRNTLPDGRGLYYLTRKIGRITQKGFSASTTKVELVPGLVNIIQAVGLNAGAYGAGAEIDANMALAAYNPVYTPLEDAIERIKTRVDSTGFAINQQFAVVQGMYTHNTYTLMWKQIPVALSRDGIYWSVYAEEYKDIIRRNIGDLRYV